MSASVISAEDNSSLFPREWEKNILNLIPKFLLHKYAAVVKLLLEQVKTEFTSEIIKMQQQSNNNECSGVVSPFWSNLNKSRLSEVKFLKNYEKLSKEYFQGTKLVKAIVKVSFMELPEDFFNFKGKQIKFLACTSIQNKFKKIFFYKFSFQSIKQGCWNIQSSRLWYQNACKKVA